MLTDIEAFDLFFRRDANSHSRRNDLPKDRYPEYHHADATMPASWVISNPAPPPKNKPLPVVFGVNLILRRITRRTGCQTLR